MPAYTLAFLRLYKTSYTIHYITCTLYNTLYNTSLNTHISLYRAIIHLSYTVVAYSIKHTITALYENIGHSGVYELNNTTVFIALAQCLLQLFIRVKKKNK